MQGFKFKSPSQTRRDPTTDTGLNIDTSRADEFLGDLTKPKGEEFICNCGDPTCGIGPMIKR